MRIDAQSTQNLPAGCGVIEGGWDRYLLLRDSNESTERDHELIPQDSTLCGYRHWNCQLPPQHSYLLAASPRVKCIFYQTHYTRPSRDYDFCGASSSSGDGCRQSFGEIVTARSS